MSQNSLPMEIEKNHLSNKDNISVIMDYSNENSISLKNSKNLFFSNKSLDKQVDDNIRLSDENKINFQRKQRKEKRNKSSKSGSRSNSLTKKERKIISMMGNDCDIKNKKIKFNELPPLNRDKKDIKQIIPQKNNKINKISNNNLNDKNKIEINIKINKRVDELNSELNKLINEPKLNNINNLETNYKKISKELEELKHENSYIKNKLEEINQKQNPPSKTSKSITSSISNNKNNIINTKQNSNKNNRQNTFTKNNNQKNNIFNNNNSSLNNKKNNINNLKINNIRNNSNKIIIKNQNKISNKTVIDINQNSAPSSPNKKNIKNINIKRVESAWRNKIPLLTTTSIGEKESKNKKIFKRNKNSLHSIASNWNYSHIMNTIQNQIKTNKNKINIKIKNNSFNNKIENNKKDKTEYEKFLDIKNKLILKKNKIYKRSESYNNMNKLLTDKNNKKDLNNSIELVNELNEKNKLIKKLNNNLLEHNKITENRISLLIKDKNIINERLYILQKEKEEYKTKKEIEIKKYINDLNINQRLIKDLNNEKERLMKSKREIE